MTNSDALDALRNLRSSILSGETELEAAQQAFERLTYLLSGVSPSDERTLIGLVNDLERIRFTRLPDSQLAAFDEVLARAEALFQQQRL